METTVDTIMDADLTIPSTVKTVEFLGPLEVETRQEPLSADLAPDEALVVTRYTAISAGTELLVYKGQMPGDIAADAIFTDHDASFSYPSRYGYAAVGVVVLCGADVTCVEKGDRVFAFREHTSAFKEKANRLMSIPLHVGVRDAVFLPNMETALSLAMDAAVLPGESVCVVGQGIVGLLLVAILRRLHQYSRVVSVDISASRREISRNSASATASLDPAQADFDDAFQDAIRDVAGADVSVDVSGSGRGLEMAIRTTRDYGRVVIGSWFGNKPVLLTGLGGRFHRSHIQLVASQVSEVPAGLSGRWTKERRFQLAWEMLEAVEPASRFPIFFGSIEGASGIYREVAEGKHLQVLFEYS